MTQYGYNTLFEIVWTNFENKYWLIKKYAYNLAPNFQFLRFLFVARGINNFTFSQSFQYPDGNRPAPQVSKAAEGSRAPTGQLIFKYSLVADNYHSAKSSEQCDMKIP